MNTGIKKMLIFIGILVVLFFVAYLMLPSLVAMTGNILQLAFLLIIVVALIYALFKLVDRLV